ncbi:MAG: STAS domain-containing protein [Hamadaea sp.]|nr:STAS domain-containing protein [Hamadaea sp.]
MASGVGHTVGEHGGVCVVALDGEIDFAVAAQIGQIVRSVLTTRACASIQVDLVRVGFLDCAGVQALVNAQAEAAARGVPLVVAGVHDGPRRVMELTGVYARLCAPAS